MEGEMAGHDEHEKQTVQEPDFRNHAELEDAVADAARRSFDADGTAIVLRRFGLDVAVFANNNGLTSAHFFEVKAFADHHGRCGFGNQRGEGNQIRLLFDHDRGNPRLASELQVFDSAIRWVIGNWSKPPGSSRFLFVSCAEAQAAAAGVRPGKQNNIRLTASRGQWITWPSLVEQIERFLLTG
jgi:hypothetical protein